MNVETIDGIAHISGDVSDWKSVVDLGHKLCKTPGVENVVIDRADARVRDIGRFRAMGDVDEADVVVIGGGISGCGIARELCAYDCGVLLLEKNSDISEGTTKANNGMIHSGYDSKHGSLKARLNVEGNALYDRWSRELGFAFNRTGSFVCGFDAEDEKIIGENFENGSKNGVPGIEMLDGDRAREIEPAISPDVAFALWTPSAGYVEPHEVALALMENAIRNCARLRLGCEVVGFDLSSDGESIERVITTQGCVRCAHVVNAAGLYADDIAEYAKDRFYSIHPRRGVLVIFDRLKRSVLRTYLGLAPKNYTKGGGPMMTPQGTMLWGPSAEETPDKEDLSVDEEGLGFVVDKGVKLLKDMDSSDMITYFAGNRASTFNEDFVICNSRRLDNFTHVAGIQSPGVASLPAIAGMACGLVVERRGYGRNKNFDPIRAVRPAFRDTDFGEIGAENVVCRCETVTEREIAEAIRGVVPATSLDAVKRRTRAGMGRCQGGFCGSRVLGILARELGCDPTEITVKGEGSNLLVSRTRPIGGACDA
ncbi:MAG: NAD(P)/FAD-dependent oxidoreductase [Synergistaceae bacterium]|jgi:glycerol-3-phosphate dehydrogenase|nr:NAD(P)/FAD-dependent oxidoreductase [Synergistaceae bacterium]